MGFEKQLATETTEYTEKIIRALSVISEFSVAKRG